MIFYHTWSAAGMVVLHGFQSGFADFCSVAVCSLVSTIVRRFLLVLLSLCCQATTGDRYTDPLLELFRRACEDLGKQGFVLVKKSCIGQVVTMCMVFRRLSVLSACSCKCSRCTCTLALSKWTLRVFCMLSCISSRLWLIALLSNDWLCISPSAIVRCSFV